MSSFTPEPRSEYRHLSEQHPDELRRRSLRQDRQAERGLTLAERQAAALERLVQQGDTSRELEDLRAQVKALASALEAQNRPLPASEPESGKGSARPKAQRA